MRASEIDTPQELISLLSDQMTTVAAIILEQAPWKVLLDLRNGIEYDGQGEVLNSIIEIVPGHLDVAIKRAERRHFIDHADHVITCVDGLPFICRATFVRNDAHRFFGFLFVMNTDMGRYLIGTDGVLLHAIKTTLPEGKYATDGERAAFIHPITDEQRELGNMLVQPADEYSSPVEWVQDGTKDKFVTWVSDVFDEKREKKMPYTIPERQYAIADLEGMDLVGYVCSEDGRRAATFCTDDLQRFVAVSPFFVDVPDHILSPNA